MLVNERLGTAGVKRLSPEGFQAEAAAALSCLLVVSDAPIPFCGLISTSRGFPAPAPLSKAHAPDANSTNHQ